MSKKKKKSVPDRKPLASYMALTKTYFDDFVKAAHKFMLLIGLEPSAFDALSKRTKQDIMQVRSTPYRIRVEKESRVPRAYLKFFNSAMGNYERTSYYGDPAFNITYLEYVTYGLTLLFWLRNYDTYGNVWPVDQVELVERIKIPLLKYMKDHEDDHYAVRTNNVVKMLFMFVTRPNYRYYTCKEGGVIDASKCRMENLLTVSSVEAERKKFCIDGTVRSSYRLGYYNLLPGVQDIAPVMAEIPMNLLEKENNKTRNQVMNQIKTAISLPVYIQNHALRRAAERMDCNGNQFINLIFSFSFQLPKAFTAVNGQRLIAARDLTGKLVGYFPFIKQDGAVLLLSFLPLSSPITPEGSILHKELGIQIEDSKYIGLDKLSFYTKTDFDAIPKLKEALKKAGMWHLTELIPDNPTERKEDQILKHFFIDSNKVAEYAEEYG